MAESEQQVLADFTLEELNNFKILKLREIAGVVGINKWQNKATLVNILKEYAVDYDEEDDKLSCNVSTISADEQMKILELKAKLAREERQAAKEKEEADRQAAREEAEANRQFELEKLRLSANVVVSTSTVSASDVMTHAGESFRYKQALDQIPPLEGDDLDSFLTTFERIVTIHRYPRDMWASLLISKLRGKVLASINLLPTSDVTVYETLRDKLKVMFKLQPEAYASKFKEAIPTAKQSYVEFAAYLRLQFDRWLFSKKVDNFDKLKELILLDKFQNVLPFDLKKYMLERTLNTLKESAELADRYVVINGGLDGQAVQGQQAVSRINNNRFMGTKKMASTVSNGGNFNSGNFKPRNGNNQNFGKKKYCSFCKSSAHDYFECYKRSKSDDANVKNVTKSQHVGFVSVLQSDINTNVIDIEYNDIFAICEHEMKNVTTKCEFERNVIFTSQNGDKMTVKCYRDNGAMLSLVKKNVLPAKFLTDLKKVTAVGTLYNKCEVPLYKVKVQLFLNEQEKEIVVGNIDNECLTP